MGVFTILKNNDEAYRFEFISRKGKPILISDKYELRFECEEDITYLQKEIERSTIMKFRTSSGKFYFRLILDKREVATSRKYTTALLMQRGIDEILRSISKSEILDFVSNDFVFPEIDFA